MKMFLRSLLVFSLLFLGRYEYLYAFTAPQTSILTIAPAHSNNEDDDKCSAIELTEEDDDNKQNIFKYLISGDNIPSFYYAPSPGYTTENTKSATFLYTHALYSSPHKYLLFGVFRI